MIAALDRLYSLAASYSGAYPYAAQALTGRLPGGGYFAEVRPPGGAGARSATGVTVLEAVTALIATLERELAEADDDSGACDRSYEAERELARRSA